MNENLVSPREQYNAMKEFFNDFMKANQDLIWELAECVLFSLIIILIAGICVRIAKKLILNPKKKEHLIDVSILKVFYNIARTVIWIIAFLIVLELFGFNTASVLTVLGAAGLTVGLAMKDSLSNVASGVMLIVLRPYKTGDFVCCGGVTGTIKEIGLFSTVMETFEGIFVAVPNNTIFSGSITNYSRNPMRRAVINVRIAYGDSLPKALESLREMLRKNELVLQDPVPEVLVNDLAENGVNLTIRFWSANDKYWDAYWQIKEQLKSSLEDAGLNIPLPQRIITVINQEK